MRKLLGIVTVCFIITTVFSGCGVLQKLGFGKNDVEELTPVSSIVMDEEEAIALADKIPVNLYFATSDNTKLKLEVRYIPMSDAKKSVNHLASVIVKELIKGPENTGLVATIPAEAELRSPITINAGVATVDFTKSFVEKHPGGKAEEQMTIYSIVNSLTEIKDIQKVKFTIEGKARADFKGNFQFNSPFPRNPALISKVAALPTLGKKDTTKDDAKKDDTKKDDAKKEDTKKGEIKKDDGKKIDDSKATDSDISDSFSEFNDEFDDYIDVLE